MIRNVCLILVIAFAPIIRAQNLDAALVPVETAVNDVEEAKLDPENPLVNERFYWLPDYGLGCSESKGGQSGEYYSIQKFTNCVWRDVTSLPHETLGPFKDDNSIRYDLKFTFPFFGQTLLGPTVAYVSSNGYLTLNSSEGASEYSATYFTSAEAPLEVIAGLFTDLTPSDNKARVLVGKYRMGKNVLCTSFQWNGFVPYGANRPQNIVKFQLDVCTNGYFITRIKRARNLNEAVIGVKLAEEGEDDDLLTEFIRFEDGKSQEDNSAFVIKPLGSHYNPKDFIAKYNKPLHPTNKHHTNKHPSNKHRYTQEGESTTYYTTESTSSE